jgi:nicotine oxidoreductase
VVQKAIDLVISEIFSPSFSSSSHGFMANRGCHTALQQISQTFRGSYWIIEADFTKCFDNLGHSELRTILSQKISCDKTLSLISKSLKAGTVTLSGTGHITRR